MDVMMERKRNVDGVGVGDGGFYMELGMEAFIWNWDGCIVTKWRVARTQT